MARTFGEPYDIEVPLRTTWQEGILFQDPDGVPVPINGKKARGSLHEVLDYDAAGNKVFGPSILDLTTEGVDANIVIPNDSSGALNLTVPASVVGDLSPDNLALQVGYDIELYDDTDPVEFVEPLLEGTISFTQRVTVP